MLLLSLVAAFALALGIGAVGSWAQRDERVLKRIAAVVVGLIGITLVVSILRGDFLRLAPGAQDLEPESSEGLR